MATGVDELAVHLARARLLARSLKRSDSQVARSLALHFEALDSGGVFGVVDDHTGHALPEDVLRASASRAAQGR
jgi:hypothetical protein